MKPSEATGELRRRLRAALPRDPRERAGALALAGMALAGLLLVLFLGEGAPLGRGALDDIEVGRIADRDIVADRSFTYVDEKATKLRVEAEERLVLPIYVVDADVGAAALGRLSSFRDLVLPLAERKTAAETLYLRVQSVFPALMPREGILALARSPYAAQAFSQAEYALARLLDRGIAAPAAGREAFNADYVELRRLRDGRLASEEVPASRMPTLRGLAPHVEEELLLRRVARPVADLASELVRAFAVENAFFDAEQSRRRLESVVKRVESVTRSVARGERIVRKGFLVTEAEMAKLEAARGALTRADFGRLAGDAGFYLALAALAFFLLGPAVSGAALRGPERLLAAAAALGYLLLALVLSRLAAPAAGLGLVFLLPTALLAMLIAVMSGQRVAALYGLVLSLLTLLAAGFEARPFAFALFSAASGAFAARSARSRIDLVRAGFLIAALQAAGAAILSSPSAIGAGDILVPALKAAANGFLSGVLCLGFLPLIEQALNVPTRFRLMELSDLNAPILKRLLTVAPGTYSHSVTVAHLAETACREIGADPLLARVGAYYHDIGKIEQPEYFVENQSGYNKHDEINPRLSATVIRSHVKLGVERARSLNLPEPVVDIVAEHHGNQLIAWFYDRAAKADPETDPEDFSYPGRPPRSKEAAVVMLADTVEAASRTLKRPTLAKLEQFVGDLVMDKVEKGQLDGCDLTFRDLGAIRDSFTRILAGHFHSRIEYPRTREPSR